MSFSLASRQILSLVKKDWQLKKRSPCASCCELILPVAIICILCLIYLIPGLVQDHQPDLHIFDGISAQQAIHNNNVLKSGSPNAQLAIVATDPALQQQIAASILSYNTSLSHSQINTNFHTEGQLIDYVQSSSYAAAGNVFIDSAIIVNSFDPTQLLFDYTLRVNRSTMPFALAEFETQITFENTAFLSYAHNGPLALQWFMDQFILGSTGVMLPPSNPTAEIPLSFQPFPTPFYRTNNFAGIANVFLGILFTIAFAFTVNRVCKVLLEEKQRKIREGMLMMGLSRTTLTMAHLTTYVIQFFIMAIMITLFTSTTVFRNSNKFFVFAFFFLFFMTIFSLVHLFTIFFSDARTGSTFSFVIFLVLYFLSLAMHDGDSYQIRRTACLSPPIAMGLGTQLMIFFEGRGDGIGAHNLTERPTDINIDYNT